MTRYGITPDRNGKVTQGLDHDPPAEEKLTPFGVLMIATGLR